MCAAAVADASMAGPCMDLVDLARQLKQERLFISAERLQLQALNNDVAKTAKQLYHLSWIARQQKHMLDQLLRAERGTTPEVCGQRTNTLELVTFVDGYKNLSYHECKIGECLKLVRENPKLGAACLVVSEKNGMETMHRMAGVMVTSLYGNCIMPEDEIHVLNLLHSLIDLQIATSDNPRRLLRKGSCAFSTVFKLLNENMFSAKLFLTAALHQPIMQLLMEDEWFYDINPNKALERFPASDRIKRFGNPGTPEYEERTRHYREFTINKLAELAQRFIVSIKNNMYCFPVPLSWIVQKLYEKVSKAGLVEATEAHDMCADLIFAMFICPAICSPEPYGITSDTPISYIARHNLMQVGQMLQVLAISRLEDIDPKTQDLYGRFEKGCLSSLLDELLSAPARDSLSIPTSLQGCVTSSVFISLSQLVELMSWLREMLTHLPEGSPEHQQLEEYLENVPPPSTFRALQNTPGNTPHATPPPTPPTSKRTPKSKERKRLMQTLDPSSAAGAAGGVEDVAEDGVDAAADVTGPPEEVLVVSLGITNDCPGMLPEHKVLEQDGRQRRVKYNTGFVPGDDDGSGAEVPLQEKRTRFSLSHDQDSIATSDNLEAISENASSHSVGSDLENEADNLDNLSDMVSANVSGRGTPTISGRDTPLSQAESVSESVEDRVEDRRAPNLPVIIQKKDRVDVTDRFGKFDIKAEIERDEIKSTVSDTWSTDVLASDSEPPEQNTLERLDEVEEIMGRHNLLGVHEGSERFETMSDAWSTDVLLASDTSERQAERLMELEQDEVASVSSRSQGPESEAGDPTDDAQGADGADGVVDGAAAAAAAGPLGNYRDISRSHLIRRNQDRVSEPGIYSNLFQTHLLGGREELPRRAVSDIVGNFNHIESNKNQYLPNPRVSSSFKYAEGKVESILAAFDPLSSASETPDEMNESQTEEPREVPPLEPPPNRCSVRQSNGGQNDDANNSSSSRFQGNSIDLLCMEADGLKLTEQQNINIDANRLSAAIRLFDPLMTESTTDDIVEPPARVRPVSEPPGGHLSQQASSMVRNSSFEGARPKVPLGVVTSTPRISVHVNSHGTDPRNDLDPRPQSDIGDMSAFERDLDQGHAATGKMADGSNLSVHSTDSLTKSRSTSESSCSSLVDATSSSAPTTPAARPITHPSDIPQARADKTPQSPIDGDDDKGDVKKKGGGSFFRTFKERISKGGKRKLSKLHSSDDKSDSEKHDKGAGGDYSRQVSSDPEPSGDETLTRNSKPPGAAATANPRPNSLNETTDDILAKYRKQPSIVQNDSASQSKARSESFDDSASPDLDPANLETCKAFMDAKRKLRLVLSMADFHALPSLATGCHGYRHGNNDRSDNELVGFLKLQLAEAINLQDKHLIAQLHETIRCLRQFDNDGIKKLVKTMREEYKSRSPYIAYLVRCRQGLLSTLAYLERLLNRIQRDKVVCNKYLLSVFVRFFLERRERSVQRFIADFQKLTVSDEKTDLVEQFLDYLSKQMLTDPIWRAATTEQLEEGRLFIERTVMGHIYTHAMYPNGDGDIHRDQTMHQHMAKLSAIISPGHKDLRIPRMYRYECPWPAAQAEIFMINAYKTPADKVQCVARCSSTIMNLLSLANERSVPAADDFMPVFIYVLIKANPPSLLSTVQYVNSFYGDRLSGEEQYWWMQFASAVEFIKTMDYNE